MERGRRAALGREGGTPLGEDVASGGRATLDGAERKHVACRQRGEVADAAAAPYGERERSVRRFDAIGVRTKPSTCRDIGVR